jgi:protocatechuate 3,4-dioxygenase beta subunit
VLVIGSTTAVLASPFAGTAFAATANPTVTAVTIDSTTQNTNTASGTAYHITGTFYPGTPTTGVANIDYTVLAGPDAPATSLTGTACAVTNPPANSQTGTYNCQVTNTTAGVDTIRVFADNNGNGTFDSGEPFADTNHTFSGPPFTLNISPSSASTTTNTCQKYVVTATDSAGRPSAQYTVKLVASEPVPSGDTQNGPYFCVPTGTTTSTLSGSGSAPPAGSSPPATNAGTGSANNFGSASQTNTRTTTANTDGNGQITIGITATIAGTVTLTASYPSNTTATASDSVTETVTAGGANSVSSLTVSPSSSTNYTGSSVTFTVTVKDANGNAVQGVPVSYFLTSGPDANSGNSSTSPKTCGTVTDSNGQVTCTFTNNGTTPPTAGTDQFTFYVNQTSGTGSHDPSLNPGEPSTTASATFVAPPSFTTLTLVCTTPGQTPPTGTTNSSGCTVPTDENAITFTAHVFNSGAPVQGAIVTFTITGSTGSVTTTGATPNTTPATGQATTDANGVATFTTTDTAPKSGDSITVTAAIGNNATTGQSTATYASRTPSKVAITPPLQTVTNGGAVVETVSVTDQFGGGVSGQNITYTVGGRNAGKTGTVTTGANGTAPITYTDAGTNPASSTDTITATDTSATAPTGTNSGNPATATIQYIAGSTTASSVTVNTATGGSSVSNPSTCPATNGTTSTNSNPGPANSGGNELSNALPVCAHVQNADGTPLAGKTVTFTVDKGTVSTAPGGANATSTQTATGTTDAAGNAFASVFSNNSGVQTVTAKADSATGTGTVTYQAPVAAAARNVALAPANSTVTPGSTQRFTATVTDLYGNGVPGVSVTFIQNGTGSIAGGSSSVQVTDVNGQASVLLSTASTDSGSGSISATIADTECTKDNAHSSYGTPTTAGNCSATVTYKVGAAAASTLTLSAPAGHTGTPEVVSGTVKDSSGNPVANVVVKFTVTGANSATGAGTTNSSGVATFTYTPTAAGTDTVNAFADSNGNGTQDSGEPTATTTITVSSATPTAKESLPAFHNSGSLMDFGNLSGQIVSSAHLGQSGDVALWGDWNGDGTPSLGVYRPSNHTFYLTNNNKTVAYQFAFGLNGDIPLAGDWDGNGTTTIGVYRPSNQTFYLANSNSRPRTDVVDHFGDKGDIPIVGDWTHSGRTSIGVYRPSTATFYRGNRANRFGDKGDRPIVGDWNGDGITTIGVIRGSTWYLTDNNSTTAHTFSLTGSNGFNAFTYSSGVSPAATIDS